MHIKFFRKKYINGKLFKIQNSEITIYLIHKIFNPLPKMAKMPVFDFLPRTMSEGRQKFAMQISVLTKIKLT